jgi:cell division protein FtsB
MNPKRSRFLLSLFYFFLIVMGILAAMLIWPAYRDYRERQEEYFRFKEISTDKRDKVNELRHDVNALERDPAAVEKVAREKFGLCEDGETVIIYNPPPKKASAVKEGSARKDTP